MTAPLITLTDVSKRYVLGTAPVMALRGVSAAFYAGECVAIMGTSGSGKSTLLNLMSCIDVPTRGTVTIDGQETSNLSDADMTRLRRDKVGIIFQFFHLLSTLTARQNVALPMLLAGRRPKDAWQRADELLSSVGLKDRLLHRPHQLSGGEMQRVAIARALANNPLVLLADEPTGNLDTQTGSEILSLLLTHCRDERRALILATHDQAAAARADRVLSLRDGCFQA